MREASEHSSSSGSMCQQRYNSRSGRGRRRTTIAPPDQRTAQLRESQRRHRERKLAYIRDLEARAASVDVAWARVSQLEEICVGLQTRLAECETNQNTIEENFNAAIATYFPSTTLNGPLDIEYSRNQLRAIPALAESPLVDKFFDCVKAQVDCVDSKFLRKHILHTLNLSSTILDACGIVDRQKVYEIMIDFKLRNKNHNIYINQIVGNTSLVCSDQDLVIEQVRIDPKLSGHALWFRESLTAINSLKDADQLIDDLRDTFDSISIGDCAEERFFKVLELSNTLKEMCKTEEEQKQFMIVTEIARYHNRGHVETVFKKLGVH
ncbi:hypothetical protein HK100_004518 [Physocladia obscura]|uniref:BZIP domain-containing protein n=1 Tax=Physocladia obscura TaxID=109957 RepID=A0AAD5STQ8_9FUNG|nr:hypothetical protein HK100_004518 [Physocladia obscura]